MSATLAHVGLPEGVRRVDLLSLIEDLGKRGLGLSSTATRVLRHYVWRSRDDDYRAGRICAVWDRVCRTADDLDLCSRAINDAERELEAKKLIVRTTGGNGARSGFRSDGVIRWAAGINLAPLIDRYADLRAAWEARRLEQQAIDTCKAEIRRTRRLIRNAAEPELLARADAILPDGRVAPIQRIEKLEAIRLALEAVLADLAGDPRAMKTSDRPKENNRPNIQNQDSSRSCSGRPEPTITPRAALDLASDEYRAIAAVYGDPRWPSLIEASRQTATWLGIGQRTWGKACSVLGRERAALCVLVIDRNARLRAGHRYQARHPGKCLSGMVRSATKAGFNLDGLLRAFQREEAATPGVHPAPSLPEHEQDQTMAFLTAQILSHIGTAMGDPA
ncbi:replication initiation protein RepC [Novosphingobium sp. MMS21-SN21R]|uniref:replication initiation protein RepC n=1 Tax=Novosphingobium sp. MMS21-SN21R TaxID=2969298 RepID=UPI00288676EE|nr:replication initiation protein RepC [Novosphingobium sp. MMS21-SN21R]MDT0507156.1 replication initiation protein RepC [Novosphingobium sp. MMS21-SN21R]